MEVLHVRTMIDNSTFMKLILLHFSGSRRLTEAVGHTGRTYDSIGEVFAEQVCKMS